MWSSEIIEIYVHNYRHRSIFRSYTCRLTIYLSSLWFRNSKFRRVLELSTKMCKTSRPSICCVHSQRRGSTQWRHSGTLLLCTPGAVRWDRDVISILCNSMVRIIEIHRIEMTALSQRTAPGVQSRRVPLWRHWVAPLRWLCTQHMDGRNVLHIFVDNSKTLRNFEFRNHRDDR